MHVTTTFRHMAPSDPLKTHAEERLHRLSKYFHEGAEAHVVMAVEKFHHNVEITINAFGLAIRGCGSSGDMYSSLDQAVD
ncbi:MAG: ribosomal subunit interface protein, partial [Phototrophicales bacterium]